MAANGGAQINLQAHEKTYSGFLTMLKFGTAISALTAMAVVLLIAR